MTTPATPTPVPLGNLCEGGGLGPFAEFLCKLNTTPDDKAGNAAKVVGSLAYLISNIIAIMSIVAGFIFIFQLLIAGFNWLTSGGDKARLEKAQQTMLQAMIGLAIVVAAYAIISLVSALLGFDILLNDPVGFVSKIMPR